MSSYVAKRAMQYEQISDEIVYVPLTDNRTNIVITAYK